MKSLPTPLSTKELTVLLAQFPANASFCRSDMVVTVYAPNGDKVLSAIKAPHKALWAVRAKEGLINVKVKE